MPAIIKAGNQKDIPTGSRTHVERFSRHPDVVCRGEIPMFPNRGHVSQSGQPNNHVERFLWSVYCDNPMLFIGATMQSCKQLIISKESLEPVSCVNIPLLHYSNIPFHFFHYSSAFIIIIY